MRCLYCGKQLPLLRRLTGSGEFCSDAHKHSYHEEYNRLALTRLIAAQSKPAEPRPAPPFTTPPSIATAADPLKVLAPPTDSQQKGRWSDPSEKPPSRLLEASIEAAPPPVASFQIQRLSPLAASIPEAEAMAIASAPNFMTAVRREWSPDVLGIQQPAAADSVPLEFPLTQQARGAPDSALAPTANVDLAAVILNQATMAAPDRAGLASRPAIRFELDTFAPDLAARAQIFSQFERFTFAVMILGAPSLPMLGGDLSPIRPTPPEVEPGIGIDPRRAVAATPFAPSLLRPDEDAPPPRPVLPSFVESRNTPLESAARSAKLNLAARPNPWSESQDIQKPVTRSLAERLAPTTEPSSGNPARPQMDKPGPQLPTIRKTVSIPSILDEPKAETDADEGLWSTLRRYIKR